MLLGKLRKIICVWEIRLQQVRNETRKNYEDVAASTLTHQKQQNRLRIMMMRIMVK